MAISGLLPLFKEIGEQNAYGIQSGQDNNNGHNRYADDILEKGVGVFTHQFFIVQKQD
jgi:hypothetical protein